MRKKFQPYEPPKYITTITFLLVIFVLIIVFGSLRRSANTEHKVVMDAENLIINTVFGIEQKLADIEDVKLLEAIPKIKAKTNGFDIKDIRRGEFNLEDLGDGRLYIHLESKLFVWIKTSDSYIIINFTNEGSTRELYEGLQEYLENRLTKSVS